MTKQVVIDLHSLLFWSSRLGTSLFLAEALSDYSSKLENKMAAAYT